MLFVFACYFNTKALPAKTNAVKFRTVDTTVCRNFFWDHFGWELCNRAYYNAIGKLRLMLTLILTPTLTA